MFDMFHMPVLALFGLDDIVVYAILWAATFAISQALTPSPESQKMKPAGLGDFNFPTATEGRIVPLVFGTVKLNGPNVLWYGDLRVFPRYEKVSAGMFNKKRMLTAFDYMMGVQFGLCLGRVWLRNIWIADKLVWNGNSSGGDLLINATDTVGTFTFYQGTNDQIVDPYLAQVQLPAAPAYRGMAYGVFGRSDAAIRHIWRRNGTVRGGWMGQSTSVEPWSFEVTRFPVIDGEGYEVGNDANPMCVIYEILTDTEWGFGYPAADIDVDTFIELAERLQSEGNGYSMVIDNPRKAKEVIGEVLTQIDGKLRLDPNTGKWTCILVRPIIDETPPLDWDVTRYGFTSKATAPYWTAPVIDETNSVLVSATRGTWDGTVNYVRIQFANRDNNYQESYAPAQDSANMVIQGVTIPSTISMPGVKDKDLANALAWRQLRSVSYPLAKARVRVGREFWDEYVGHRVNFSNARLNIVEMPMRVFSIDYGTFESQEIELELMQDVFSEEVATYDAAPASGWVAPDTTLVGYSTDDAKIFEAPYAFTRRDENTDAGRIWCMAAASGLGELGYRIQQRHSAGTPSGSYYDAGDVTTFAAKGTLATAVDQDETTIDLTIGLAVQDFALQTASEAGDSLNNLMLLGDEFILPLSAVDITGGVRLTVLRGVMDSAQAAHAEDEVVWFMHGAGALTVWTVTESNNVDIMLLPYLPTGEQVSAVSPVQINMDYRERRPYPPSTMQWNGVAFPATVDPLSPEAGIEVEVSPRDYRIYNEGAHTANDGFGTTFFADTLTEYRLELWSGGSMVWNSAWSAGSGATYTHGSVFDVIRTATLARYFAQGPVTVKVATRHTYGGVVYEALQKLEHTAPQTGDLVNDTFLGVLDVGQTSVEWTAPTSGTYVFSTPYGTFTGGDIQAKINGGTLQTIIAAGASTGNLTGVVAGDIIEIRSTATGASDGAAEKLLRIDAPGTTVDGYEVLIFVNTYWMTGGFGRGGFGLGKFGR